MKEVLMFKNFDNYYIPKIHELYEEKFTFILVFDCDHKQTLEDYVKKNSISHECWEEFGLKLSYVLKYIHSKKIALNSLRPDNILYDSLYRDFFIVSLAEASSYQNNSNVHVSKTRPGYSSAEALNLETASFEGDIFVLGALLFFW
jgi:serine/threonine protein kinase